MVYYEIGTTKPKFGRKSFSLNGNTNRPRNPQFSEDFNCLSLVQTFKFLAFEQGKLLHAIEQTSPKEIIMSRPSISIFSALLFLSLLRRLFIISFSLTWLENMAKGRKYPTTNHKSRTKEP